MKSESANNDTPPCVLVTGVSGGIGGALASTFAHAGYTVIATDSREAPTGLDAAHFLQIDLVKTVRDESYAEEIFNQIRELLPDTGLNALINNAAVQILGSSAILTRSDWSQTLDVNLLAPFFWTQAFLKELEAAEGCVVNISSIHARLTKKNFLAYATSKAALSGMTRAMALDLGNKVRINTIEPAAIETEMLQAGFKNKPKLYEQLKDCHPQKRIGNAFEVSELALFIINGSAQFLHGATINLDGGISNRLFDPD